jgi:hypothetical protein
MITNHRNIHVTKEKGISLSESLSTSSIISSDVQGGINPIIINNDSVSIITLLLDYAVY